MSSSESSFGDRELIDRLADEFEANFQQSDAGQIEDYLAKHPDIADDLFEALLKVELDLRRSRGDKFEKQEYVNRFPQREAIIGATFDSTVTGIENSGVGAVPTADFSSDELASPPEPATESKTPIPERIGRYKVEQVLGQGAFGVVYRAQDTQLDRPVALKVPRAERFTGESDVERFLDEARTAARLKHAGLVAVYDVQAENGLPYIVQEFVEGSSLAEWLRGNQPTYQQVAELFVAIAEALGYAHQEGLTHCDLKLANVLMDLNGNPHVADFGLAVHEKEQSRMRGKLFGTPVMMAPEQVRGEGHRLDGRTDIWAVGIMLYEIMTGRRPFTAKSTDELFDQIKTLDPRPPRSIDRSLPRELERICLKCINKRRTDRYNTVDDLRDDLLAWLRSVESTEIASSTTTPPPQSDSSERSDSSSGASAPPPKIIPKGLRSFDADDADFFLELLPGPRDRYGLPESIRFWKQRIEELNPDKSFAVGLIYGPSGCGKSSLLQAGLLPRLADHVIAIYVEATGEDTEVRLLKQLKKHLPQLPDQTDLPTVCAELRRGNVIRNAKVVLVIDQFEQWLHSHPDLAESQLVAALRHCEGEHLQAVLLIRDDFYLSVNLLFQELEIPLAEGKNQSLVDLFNLKHAEKVLTAFGLAYGCLDEELTDSNRQFLAQAVEGLAVDHKVISVRLALFADMLQGRPWEPASLAAIGGVSGVGVQFLEEKFDASTAPPTHRKHQAAIRQVLKALLPESGTDIKGGMCSAELLRETAGYGSEHRHFEELLRILDTEQRIITPTDPAGDSPVGSSASQTQLRRYYQLTHDYLVPALRDWLTRKQRETRRGRAELLLAERAATWNAKPENRQLPSTLECLRIHTLSRRANWTAPQKKMMQRANRVKGVFWLAFLALFVVTGIGIQQGLASLERQTSLDKTRVRIQSLQDVQGSGIPLALENLDELPRNMVVDELQSRFTESSGQQKLNLAYGLAQFAQVEINTLLNGLTSDDTDPDEVDNIASALGKNESQSLKEIASGAADATRRQDWSTKARLAIVALHLGDKSLAAEMLRDQPKTSTPEVVLPDLLTEFRQQIVQSNALPEDQRDSPAQRLKMAVAHYYLDQDEQALAEFEQLANGDSANWEVWLRQAVCLARVGKGEEARESLDQLSATTRTESLIAYANILVEAWLGNLDEVEQKLREMIAGSPEDSGTQYNAACIAAQLVRLCRQNNVPGEDRFKQLALQRLQSAYTELGYSGSSELDNDADFIPLYKDEDFLALVGKLKPPAIPFDPIQRTIFIREFAEWSGAVEPLAELLADIDTPALRSGICLSLGRVEKPGQTAKELWQPILANWVSKAPDGGTHSAADWALSQWNLPTPEIVASKQPPVDRDWWHEPNGLSFVQIKAGNVTGDNGPIVVADDYWLSDSEITVGLFKQFMADDDYPGMKPTDWDGAEVFANDEVPGLPVQKVSWYDAVMFCNWLSWKLDLESCYEIEKSPPRSGRIELLEPFVVTWLREANGIRLPTSSEWEYACRASTTSLFSFGDNESDLLNYGWFGLNSNERTHLIRTKLCNAWGLFDMHGNVEEWCWDPDDSDRVSRGGGWYLIARSCQSGIWTHGLPWYRDDDGLGFRVALSSAAR